MAENTAPIASTDAQAAPAGAGQQDALDKGVDGLLKKSGHGQNASTTEKISDGVRSAFKKVSGKDVPIADKQ
ncbi:hypothetical protein IAR55_001114 [Kwoniella newhampshirensis]|uniref:Uncharacterized protein n=1 Tax=Kwoniella newhampshirensis TaxID=1651941 RepID=A0AAW0Z4W7_9TREE